MWAARRCQCRPARPSSSARGAMPPACCARCASGAASAGAPHWRLSSRSVSSCIVSSTSEASTWAARGRRQRRSGAGWESGAQLRRGAEGWKRRAATTVRRQSRHLRRLPHSAAQRLGPRAKTAAPPAAGSCPPRLQTCRRCSASARRTRGSRAVASSAGSPDGRGHTCRQELGTAPIQHMSA